MKTKFIIAGAIALLLGGAFAMAKGKISAKDILGPKNVSEEKKPMVKPPSVSLATVTSENFVEKAFVTGSLVARDEILVAPEIEGLRILDIAVEEGDRVKQGQVLATLVQDTLNVELAQNAATIARAKAAVAQAKSAVIEATARLAEATAQLERARPLKKKGYLSGATFDQRNAAMRTAKAQLASAKDGIGVAEAELAQQEAERRNITWRLARTDIRAPADGVISRKTARIGGMATAAGDPMFHIIRDGEIELEGEVTETELAKIKPGQIAKIEVAGVGMIKGTVRYVSPEVSRDTRFGHVRISLDQNPGLRIGAFARGTIETKRKRGLSIPMAAVMYSTDAKHVLRVIGDKVEQRAVETGLQSHELIEITSGLAAGDLVVAKAGTFLRDGDQISPVLPKPVVSEAR